MTVWIDGDGCPRQAKELCFRVAQRGRAEVVIVANRPLALPKSPRIRQQLVGKGLDVADDWLVANAGPGELVVTSDVPLAAELVARGVEVVTPRGDVFDKSNVGEKLAMRDFFTEARASGMMEGGGGPPPYDDRAARRFADVLNAWVGRWERKAATPRG
jgi:uncharacterized protein YaiI (UPF0178 family)